ncbi:MAG: hypothetical protein ABI995_01535 [Acidobacteriota bacterium]
MKIKAAEPISIACPEGGNGPYLPLYVIFTDIPATKAALQNATRLARDLQARLIVVAAQVVPYPLPLDEPPVSGAFTARVLSQLAAEQEADVEVRVYQCRDRNVAIRKAIKPESLVMIGSSKRWWPNRTTFLARLLKRDGHRVILTPTPLETP